MYEHGDTISIRNSSDNQDVFAIIVDRNSSLWERIIIAWKIIKGFNQ